MGNYSIRAIGIEFTGDVRHTIWRRSLNVISHRPNQWQRADWYNYGLDRGYTDQEELARIDPSARTIMSIARDWPVHDRVPLPFEIYLNLDLFIPKPLQRTQLQYMLMLKLSTPWIMRMSRELLYPDMSLINHPTIVSKPYMKRGDLPYEFRRFMRMVEEMRSFDEVFIGDIKIRLGMTPPPGDQYILIFYRECMPGLWGTIGGIINGKNIPAQEAAHWMVSIGLHPSDYVSTQKTPTSLLTSLPRALLLTPNEIVRQQCEPQRALVYQI